MTENTFNKTSTDFQKKPPDESAVSVLYASLTGVSALEKHISMKFILKQPRNTYNDVINLLSTWRKQNAIARIKISRKEDSHEFVFVNVRVRSINFQEKMRFVLHAEKDSALVKKLIDLMGDVIIKIISASSSHRKSLDNKLDGLLQKVSERTGEEKSQLLKKLTTFKTSDGRIVEGKENLQDLSEKHKQVVINKLERMLSLPR